MKVTPIHLIIISMVVFTVLNITENLIHYNIGKGLNNDFILPTLDDWIKIIITMIIFAILQGYLTEYISEKY
jgi:hypothetical protein